MKITKSAKQVTAIQNERLQALQGCDKCPCCGETKKWIPLIQSGGICRIGEKIEIKGIIHIRVYHIDCFECESCGAQWESEPYRTGVI